MIYLFDKLENGVVWVNDKPDLVKLKQGKYKLELKVLRGKVSNNQFRYYYGVIIKYWAEETGYGPTQQDYELKKEFSRTKGWLNKFGDPIIPSKSRDFDTKDQEELNRFARDLYYEMFNGVIPLPHETEYNYEHK